MYGYICPQCGSWLDPGERCDCSDRKKLERKELEESFKELVTEGKGGQLAICLGKERT